MIDWTQIDTVLLDMDGTLLDLHFDNYFWQHHLPQAYARKHSIPLAEAERVVFAQFSDKHSTLDWYCLDYWSRQLQLDIVALKREVQHLIAIRPGTLDFLKFLRERGKRTVLITNAHRGSLDLKMQHTGIDVWLDRLVSSHDLGHPKEHPAFWQALSVHEPFVPARTLFIDDTHPVLDAAKRAGIAHAFGIVMPDSKGVVREHDAHYLISDFSELIR